MKVFDHERFLFSHIQNIPAGCTVQCSGATPVVMPYPGTPSYTVPGLTPYTNYTFEMVVVNPAGCGHMSPPRMTETLQDGKLYHRTLTL